MALGFFLLDMHLASLVVFAALVAIPPADAEVTVPRGTVAAALPCLLVDAAEHSEKGSGYDYGEDDCDKQ